jgi:hypothetical protein
MRLPSCRGARSISLESVSLGLLLFVNLGAIAGQAPSCPGIHVTILNIRNGIADARVSPASHGPAPRRRLCDSERKPRGWIAIR